MRQHHLVDGPHQPGDLLDRECQSPFSHARWKQMEHAVKVLDSAPQLGHADEPGEEEVLPLGLLEDGTHVGN